MRRVVAFPHQVHEVENLWIPLADGTRLAARAWLPADAVTHQDANPVPAIVESIPYRKRGGTRWRDEPIHRYFAGHGYASLRIDVRGSGESEGLLADEYSEDELADGLEALAWIASRPWCSGRIGLIGKSWGGIHALQLAARRPPSLGAVITVCSSDDLWTTDAHYMGGCLLNENLIWGAHLVALAALPPDPEIVGEAWRQIWHHRLEHLPLYPAVWMEHPTRDEYWTRGSLREDPSRIACPVLAVGGWADPYRDTVFRLLSTLDAPRHGLVGPWAHLYPHDGEPGPAIGFLQEAVAWWDRWLKERENEVASWPALRAWMPGSGRSPGRWIVESEWPSQRITDRGLRLSELTGAAATEGAVVVSSPPSTGADAGSWCPFGAEDLPGDQRRDDERSACLDSSPLEQELEILGTPSLRLKVVSDRPRAILAARLCDVAPDGSSRRVTYGLLDLGFRDGPEEPRLLEPGRPVDVRIELGAVAWSFAPGHRIRLALSTAYWPIAWPAPQLATLQVDPAESELSLPVRERASSGGDRGGETEWRPPPPEAAPEPPHAELGLELSGRELRDLGGGLHELVFRNGVDARGEVVLLRYDAIGLATGTGFEGRFRIHDDDPLSAEAIVTLGRRMERPSESWSVGVDLRCRLTADAAGHSLEARLEARESGRVVFTRRWDRSLPRWSG